MIFADGGWSEWSVWDLCTLTCGGGIQTHTRTCSNPTPEHGGQECQGNDSEAQSCNEDPCSVGTLFFIFCNII